MYDINPWQLCLLFQLNLRDAFGCLFIRICLTKTRSHFVTQVGPELTTQLKLESSSCQSSCLGLLNPGITGNHM